MPSVVRRCQGLDSLELKALSVPSSLHFLLGIEYDVVLCVTEVGSRKAFVLHFPAFAETFRKLLSLCANRFSLDCQHHEDGSSTLSGTATMPLLRYADYLPGALHVEEILECLQAKPASFAKRHDGAGTGSNEFDASFLDYSQFTSDASLNDVYGLGFYLTLDYGLSLASHGHLVDIRLHSDWDLKEAIREFQEFSGWDTFDLRFYDDQNKHEGGVIVFPTIQDVCDLLEKYEDEDSDDEGDVLPFILRPVAPLVSVPSIEDSVFRKQREQNWPEILQFWQRFPKTKNTVVVYNLFDGATLQDILSFLESLPIVQSSFVEDSSPQKRRRAFITFADAESTRKALDLDGKSTKGRTLRVQISPPYITESRRGNPVKDVKPKPKGTNPTGKEEQPRVVVGEKAHQARTAESAPQREHNGYSDTHGSSYTTVSEGKSGGLNKGDIPKPKSSMLAGVAVGYPSGDVKKSDTTANAAKTVESAWAHSVASSHQHQSGTSTAPAAAAPANHFQIPAPFSVSAKLREGAGPSSGPASKSASPSLMNADAKEFVPTFKLNASSPEFHPDAPPAYNNSPAQNNFVCQGGGDGATLPPTYTQAVSPIVGFSQPSVAVPLPRSGPASAKITSRGDEHGQAPPNYSLPPPYQGGANSPAGGVVAASKQPMPPPFGVVSSDLLFAPGGSGALPPPPPPPPPYR